MKRWSVLFLALALWALAGCGGPAADEAAAGEAPSVFAEASAPDAEGGLSAARLEGQARPLTDEEIQAAYFRAEEAYGWFSLETLPCGEKTQTIDGWLYHPVEYPGMENLADLRAYLRGLFSEELVDALLASGGLIPCIRMWTGPCTFCPPAGSGTRPRDRRTSRSSRTARRDTPS